MTLRRGYCHVKSEFKKAAMSKNWNTMSIVRCTFRWSICRSIDAGCNELVSESDARIFQTEVTLSKITSSQRISSPGWNIDSAARTGL